MVTVIIHGSLVYGAPNRAYSEEWSAPDETLIFLTDVIGFDMIKYNAQLSDYHVEYPSDYGGLTQEEVIYTLESARSKLFVGCVFINKTLAVYGLKVLEGSPLYVQPQPANVLDATKGLLDRYQTYSGASHLQEMQDMLDIVTEIANMTTISGNVKFQMSVSGNLTSISWMYTCNGIDFIVKKIGVSFKNGALRGFQNNWDLYKVGSTDVNVSEEEAIRIARERAKDYMVNVWPGPDVELDLVEEPLITRLTGSRGREPLTLYPFWFVELYFNKVYNNSYAMQVGIWADTGEIEYCHATGFMGGSPDGETPTTPTTDPPPEDSTGQTNLDPTPLLIAVPIVLAIILGVAFHRRKKRGIQQNTSGKAEKQY
ncbi:MAG: hypothetical protein OEY81_07300 [Candidatus Bathyarchaeota archaeon]|nr:hypothetical protein [Candidatus Bathyarchaeota archaeon]